MRWAWFCSFTIYQEVVKKPSLFAVIVEINSEVSIKMAPNGRLWRQQMRIVYNMCVCGMSKNAYSSITLPNSFFNLFESKGSEY